MTSYLSGLLTSTTSKYTTLRRNLLSDESDGDTENDSHISRVLRAYYTEKGRAFPEWLPPDPTRPQAQPSSQSYSYSQQQRPPAQSAPRSRGALSDLWADSPSQPQQHVQQPPSLRTGRSQLGAGIRPDSTGSTASLRAQPGGARPLPSQRDGSYQSSAPGRGQDSVRPSLQTSTSTMSTASAQDKLKARLWGAGRQ